MLARACETGRGIRGSMSRQHDCATICALLFVFAGKGKMGHPLGL
jgi:hypothetical protein